MIPRIVIPNVISGVKYLDFTPRARGARTTSDLRGERGRDELRTNRGTVRCIVLIYLIYLTI
jgi:hypothetical protein